MINNMIMILINRKNNDTWYLVGGSEHEFYDFPFSWECLLPTDELIFFRGVGQPPTRYIVDLTDKTDKWWLMSSGYRLFSAKI